MLATRVIEVIEAKWVIAEQDKKAVDKDCCFYSGSIFEYFNVFCFANFKHFYFVSNFVKNPKTIFQMQNHLTNRLEIANTENFVGFKVEFMKNSFYLN